MKKSIFLLALILGANSLIAQQVNTLYFLENSPQRHTINPALVPVSNGYISFPALGGITTQESNSGLTMSDLIFKGPNGNYITAFKSPETQQEFLKKFGTFNQSTFQVDLNLLSFGFRVKEKNFVHIGLSQKIDMGLGIPRSPLDFVLGSNGLANGETLSLSGMSVNASSYTQVALGYNRAINDKLSIGLAVKALLGELNMSARFDKLDLTASKDEWKIEGEGAVHLNAPINVPNGQYKDYNEVIDVVKSQFNAFDTDQIMELLKPSGLGASFDLGAVYKPIEMLQISLAVTDLGFMRWNKGVEGTIKATGSFTGLGDVDLNNMDSVGARLENNLNSLINGMSYKIEGGMPYNQFLTGRFNAGVDANFLNNRIGVGVLNQMRWYNGRIYDELTIGASLRPCNWFNLAVSYSLIDNAKYSDIGAGISLMPYDGINLTLTADYIPTKYMNNIPYKTKGVNVEMALSIVWGTNKKKDKASKEAAESVVDLLPEKSSEN